MVALSPRARRTGRPATNLLAGLVRCGLCGAKLTSSASRGGGRRYICAVRPGAPGCGGISISAAIEGSVRDQVLFRLAGEPFADKVRAAGDDDTELAQLAARLRGDQAALEELAADFYTMRLISRAEFLAARTALEDSIEAARRALTRTADRGVLADLPADEPALRALWEARDVDWRRAVLAAVVERVEIARSVGRRFDPGRAEVVWRA